jgi:hypothetical protein
LVRSVRRNCPMPLLNHTCQVRRYVLVSSVRPSTAPETP